jgi:hypothetical protein
LAIREPDRYRFDEQLAVLEGFFRSLVYHLRNEDAMERLEIYLEGQHKKISESLFLATGPLLKSRYFIRSRKQCDIVYLLDNIDLVRDSHDLFGGDHVKARVYHWLDAPDDVRRRFPMDHEPPYRSSDPSR